MKKKIGLVYYSIPRRHFCVAIDDTRFRDLTTHDEFYEMDDSNIRNVMPEDLFDSTIVVESPNSNSHYVRLSYSEVADLKKVNDLISVEVDKNGRLVGVKLNYPWAE